MISVIRSFTCLPPSKIGIVWEFARDVIIHELWWDLVEVRKGLVYFSRCSSDRRLPAVLTYVHLGEEGIVHAMFPGGFTYRIFTDVADDGGTVDHIAFTFTMMERTLITRHIHIVTVGPPSKILHIHHPMQSALIIVNTIANSSFSCIWLSPYYPTFSILSVPVHD